ncbi:MAG: flavodoxin [[Clostridium] fimetarium]|nr:flavodoxin [Alistipes timonensis]MCM1406310.1 flavodoxin [[Clostridium] fimetarium]
MKRIGIFYGSQTGTTKYIASRIAAMLNVDEKDVHNVKDTAPSAVGDYDILVLGTSTWGAGKMECDWYDFLDGLEALDLGDKQIALFGCGDETMEDTFCSGVGEIYDRLKQTGARFIAPYDTIGYTFESSRAKPDDALEAEGLLLDEVNHPELTDRRLRGWTLLVADAAK